MQQIMLRSHTAGPRRRLWRQPSGRDVLRLDQVRTQVLPLFDPGAPPEARRRGRETTLEFLARHHYLHRAGGRAPAITWLFGLFLNEVLAGIAVLNPPADGVCRWLYGSDRFWRRRVIALTRLCCTDAAPYNAESHLVAPSGGCSGSSTSVSMWRWR